MDPKMKNRIMRILAIVLVIGMLLPLSAFAAKGYSITISIKGPDQNGEEKFIEATSDRYGSADDSVAATVATLYAANENLIRTTFAMTDLSKILEEGIDALDSENAWNTFVGKYEHSGKMFDAYGVSMGELNEGEANTITYTGMRGKYTVTVTLNIYNPISGGVVVTPAVDKAYTAAAKTAAACAFDEKCVAHKFTDLTEKWYHEGFHFCVDTKLMIGVSETDMAPLKNVTRAQLATILYRVAGEPTTLAAKKFSDVSSGDWFYKQVEWAAEKNLFTVGTDGTFGPGVSMTREEVVTVLYRYAKMNGLNAIGVKGTSLAAFSDTSDVSESAVPAFQWAVSKGIIDGIDGKLSPASMVTRAQVATIIYRFVTA